MGIVVSWDNLEQTAIRWDFEGRWTIEDLCTVEETTLATLANTAGVVDLVLNFESTSFWPKKGYAVFKNALKRCSQGSGVAVLVGASLLVQSVLTTQAKYDQPFGDGVIFVEHLWEAQELLQD